MSGCQRGEIARALLAQNGEKAQEVLNKISENIHEKDSELLKKIAMTAITGKGAESNKEYLANISVNAIRQVLAIENNKMLIDMDSIKIEKKM